jgi:hypothetical protein
MSNNYRHTGEENMNIYELRKLAGREEIDYLFLMNALKEYRHPRDKVSEWLKSGELIRVKKGLYVFGESAAQQPFSREVLANLIYGPSAISSTYALYHYGIITERVEVVTSITSKRDKYYSTPVGVYDYRYLSANYYPYGIQFEKTLSGASVLMASPEKALYDFILLHENPKIWSNDNKILPYLLDELRLDEPSLSTLNYQQLFLLTTQYRKPVLRQILTVLKRYFHWE